MPQFAAAMGCFERLQAFLLLPAVVDTATRRNGIDDDSVSTSAFEQPLEVEMQTFRSTVDVEPAVITVTNATIRPTPASPAVLSDATFRVGKGSITALLGPTGSGKTTLLRTILGELRPDSGEVSPLSGPIAYCAQTPWMVNRSIRLNICGPFAGIRMWSKRGTNESSTLVAWTQTSQPFLTVIQHTSAAKDLV